MNKQNKLKVLNKKSKGKSGNPKHAQTHPKSKRRNEWKRDPLGR